MTLDAIKSEQRYVFGCAIGDGSCAGCPMFEANLEHCKSDYTHLKSIIEWLRGDAE